MHGGGRTGWKDRSCCLSRRGLQESQKKDAPGSTQQLHTVTKCLFEHSYTLSQMGRFDIRSVVVRDAVDQVCRIGRRGVASMTVDVYDIRPHPVHGYGCKDRDQSRDWCAFAANGIGLD